MKYDLPKLTLLKEDQIWGRKQLEVIKKCGTKVAITDLAILTGGYVSSDYHVDEDSTLSGRTGWIWTSSDDKDGDVRAVDDYGDEDVDYRYARRNCVCPVLQSSAILNTIPPNIVRGINGVEEVELGEYPQMAVDGSMQQILEREYANGAIRKTGKDYTFDSRSYDDYDNGFSPVVYDEYEYQGKKYIRIKANTCYDGTVKLSNRMEVKTGDYVWVEVEPVVFRIDRKTGTLVSKKGLVSGIRYHEKKTEYKGGFKKTEMYTYLNTHMVKEMFTSKSIKTRKEETEEDEITKLINKIKRLIEPMEDSKEQEILDRIDKLIEGYNQNTEVIKPTLSFTSSLELVQEDTFLSLKAKLIAQLEAIIQSLYENDKLLSLLDEIKRYRELQKEKLDIPSSMSNIENKIIFIIMVSRMCNQPIIIQQLDHLFNQVTSKISDALSHTFEQNISLTLESQQSVQKLFAKMIENTFATVERYYIIQMVLRGIGESKLALEIAKLYQILSSLEEEQQKKYDLEFGKIKEEMTLDICVNNDIEKIMKIIRKRIEPIARELKFYGGAVEETRKEIITLLENPELSEDIKKQAKKELDKVLQEWGKRVANNEDVNSSNPIYDNLDKDTIRQLQCLKELNNIKYYIEMYLSNLKEYHKSKRYFYH